MMNNLSTLLEKKIGHTDLVQLCSELLQTGFSKASLYSEFYNYLSNHNCSDDLEDEITDVLDILDGYHNPYVVVNESGISTKTVII